MAETIPMWAKERAVALANSHHNNALNYSTHDVRRDGHGAITALALHVLAHEEAPVDPLLIEARKLAAHHGDTNKADGYLGGYHDSAPFVRLALASLNRGMELAGKSS